MKTLLMKDIFNDYVINQKKIKHSINRSKNVESNFLDDLKRNDTSNENNYSSILAPPGMKYDSFGNPYFIDFIDTEE